MEGVAGHFFGQVAPTRGNLRLVWHDVGLVLIDETRLASVAIGRGYRVEAMAGHPLRTILRIAHPALILKHLLGVDWLE